MVNERESQGGEVLSWEERKCNPIYWADSTDMLTSADCGDKFLGMLSRDKKSGKYTLSVGSGIKFFSGLLKADKILVGVKSVVVAEKIEPVDFAAFLDNHRVSIVMG